jgi:uncharacterized protein (TIGR02266 family)
MSRVSVESYQGLEPSGAERRRSSRAELIVRVDYSTVDEMFSEFTSDINEGGVFIETENPQPAGTEVALHFNLPGSDRLVKTTGVVVRVSDGKHGEPAGMGIEFEDLPADARTHIDQLIRLLRSDHTAVQIN